MLADMQKLIREKNVCVLATISEGKPYCSLMAYAADEEGREIYLATLRDTRKFRNLMANAAVSLLIDSRETIPRTEAQALTAEGVCAPIEDPGRRAIARERLLAANPHLESFLDDPRCALVCVRLTSLLLLKGLTEAHRAELD
jgi:nitroimidazol reductase NimA-like FMN-containing flavoprotein (pyridoxamine 5'-phosphate oxidase superfamily)